MAILSTQSFAQGRCEVSRSARPQLSGFSSGVGIVPKIILPLATLALLLIATCYVAVEFIYKDAVIRGQQAFISAISKTSESYLLSGNLDALQRYLDSLSEAHLVRAVVVTDIDGQIVASTYQGGPIQPLEAAPGDRVDLQVTRSDSNTSGSVSVEFKEPPVGRSIRLLAVSGSVVALVWLACAVFVSIRIGKRVTETIEAIRKNEERQRFSLVAANVGTWETKFETGEEYWSEESHAVLGLPPERHLKTYEDWEKIVHPEDLPGAVRAIQRVKDGERSYVNQYRIIWPNGDVHWLHVCGESIVDESGKLTGMRGTFWDITDSRTAEEALKHLAKHDSLTDLPNRSLLNDRLEHAANLAVRNGKSLALLFLDLDGFKFVNDTYGHSQGDRLLQLVAMRIIDCVRASDTVARLGGDEFAILLESIESRDDVELVAAKILRELSQPFPLLDADTTVSSSIGVSIFPTDGRDLEALLQCADKAMYQAKKMGKGNVQFHSSTAISLARRG